MKSGTTAAPLTFATASQVIATPTEGIRHYLRLTPRLRRGYRNYLAALPDGLQRLKELDEQVSQWPADWDGR